MFYLCVSADVGSCWRRWGSLNTDFKRYMNFKAREIKKKKNFFWQIENRKYMSKIKERKKKPTTPALHCRVVTAS